MLPTEKFNVDESAKSCAWRVYVLACSHAWRA